MRGLQSYNKKGQVLSSSLMLGWRLILITALTLFVVLTVGSAFTSKKDVRPLETTILSHNSLDCISDEGIIPESFNLNNCFNDKTELFVFANLTSLDSNFSKSSNFGNKDIGVYCKLSRNSIYCSNQTFYVLLRNKDGKIEGGILKLTMGVRKYESNI